MEVKRGEGKRRVVAYLSSLYRSTEGADRFCESLDGDGPDALEGSGLSVIGTKPPPTSMIASK